MPPSACDVSVPIPINGSFSVVCDCAEADGFQLLLVQAEGEVNGSDVGSWSIVPISSFLLSS